SAHESDSVNLWKVSISRAGWQVSGTPQRLTFGSGQSILPSAASDGRLVFCALGDISQVWRLPMNHKQGKPVSEMKQVTHDSAPHAWPSISADGKKLVYASRQRKSWDIWLKNFETGKTKKLTESPVNGVAPALDPAGSKVAFGQPFRQPGQTWP